MLDTIGRRCPGPRRRLGAAAVLVGFAAALIVVPSTQGGAQRLPTTRPRGTAPITWLAAGDSYSSGQGLNNTTEPCARGDFKSDSLAYPIEAYDDLRPSMPELKSPEFTACTGAVTANFFNAGDAEHRQQWTPSMGRYNLVTFTFGGDNINFSGVIAQCVLGTADRWPLGQRVHNPDPGHNCPADSWVRRTIANRLGAPYLAFLTAVADQAVEPGGNIVVLGYPELVELPRFWPAVLRHLGRCAGLRTDDATQLRGDAGDLNATIGHDVAVVNARHPNGVHLQFLDVNSGGRVGSVTIARNDPYLFEPSSGARHNLCGAGAGWMNGLVGLHLGTRSFHPSLLGNIAEGHLLAQVIPYLDWSRVAVVRPPTMYSVSLDSLCSNSGVSNDSMNGCPADGTTQIDGASVSYNAFVSNNNDSVNPSFWNLIDFPSNTCSSVTVTFGIPDDGGQIGDVAYLNVVDGSNSYVEQAPYGSVGTLTAPLDGQPWSLNNSASSTADEIAIDLTANCATSTGF